MSLARDLIEAMAADINAKAGLPAHGTVRGRRPRALFPEACPLLVVWLDAKRPEPVGTIHFDAEMTIGISWHEEAVAEVETLIDDEDLSWGLMENLERIEARIREWSRSGLAVLPAWQIVPGESTYIGPLPQQGLVEGYAIEATVALTET